MTPKYRPLQFRLRHVGLALTILSVTLAATAPWLRTWSAGMWLRAGFILAAAALGFTLAVVCHLAIVRTLYVPPTGRILFSVEIGNTQLVRFLFYALTIGTIAVLPCVVKFAESPSPSEQAIPRQLVSSVPLLVLSGFNFALMTGVVILARRRHPGFACELGLYNSARRELIPWANLSGEQLMRDGTVRVLVPMRFATMRYSSGELIAVRAKYPAEQTRLEEFILSQTCEAI